VQISLTFHAPLPSFPRANVSLCVNSLAGLRDAITRHGLANLQQFEHWGPRDRIDSFDLAPAEPARPPAGTVLRAAQDYMERLGRAEIPARDKPTTEVWGLLHTLISELVELNHSFELRWEADMRAIQRWRAEDPKPRELCWPDHADLCLWLLRRLEPPRDAGPDRVLDSDQQPVL